MVEALKDRLNLTTVKHFSEQFQTIYPAFPAEDYVKITVDKNWENLELKGRWQLLARNLGKVLPKDYKKAIQILEEVVEKLADSDGMFLIIFPDFVEFYGQDLENWDLSIKALKKFTQYSSSEMAVRPFILQDEPRMMAQMLAWSKDENEHVRRLASEGCRPQLPWAQTLPNFKQDPTAIFPILEQLKADPSEYVRRSVANNLNDISKTHPELVTKLAKEWYGKDQRTDWIVKHACRTLLKKGNREAMALFGFQANVLKISDFVLDKKKLAIGERLSFSFIVKAEQSTKIRLEYGIDYVKKNGKQSRKIFQIIEGELEKNEEKIINKSQAFSDLSTRKHYPGTHRVILIANGIEQENIEFDLGTQV